MSMKDEMINFKRRRQWSSILKKRCQLNANLQNFMSLRYDVSYFAPALDIYVTSFIFILILRRDATSFCVPVHPTTFRPSFSANNTVVDSHDAWNECEATECVPIHEDPMKASLTRSQAHKVFLIVCMITGSVSDIRVFYSSSSSGASWVSLVV